MKLVKSLDITLVLAWLTICGFLTSMLFTTLQYIIFLPLVVALFWLLPSRFRLPMLLVASYYFYMCCVPIFIVLIFGMTLLNWLWGNLLERAGDQKKLLFGLGIAANLLCLGYFKYTNFFLQSASDVVRLATHHNPGWHIENIILPLGISFFTFEFIHYLFEIYRGGKPIKSFVLFALFAAFFPTQIAGPIKRYKDFEAQMLDETKFSFKHFDEGVPLIIVGMAKKLLLADNLATFVNMGFGDPRPFGAPELWLFAYAFAFQIYFDFSGYTDIGRGSAMLFGYHIPLNFNMPYFARNMSDFWRRWHISLSTWLRDYLFIPLGGSRAGDWKTNRNLFLTMAIGGLWHGASWNFIIWGVYHGLALIVHRLFGGLKSRVDWLRLAVDSRYGQVAAILVTFHAVCIGWIFFRVQDIGHAFLIVRRMLVLSPIMTKSETHGFLVLNPDLPVLVPVVLVMIAVLIATNLPLSFAQERGWIARTPAPLKAAFCAVLVLAMISLQPDNNTPFIYFQF